MEAGEFGLLNASGFPASPETTGIWCAVFILSDTAV
jgi:hypothetical protein